MPLPSSVGTLGNDDYMSAEEDQNFGAAGEGKIKILNANF